ncbi:MAG: hypothetical protein Kow0026_25440 [Oricola sp.]
MPAADSYQMSESARRTYLFRGAGLRGSATRRQPSGGAAPAIIPFQYWKPHDDCGTLGMRVSGTAQAGRDRQGRDGLRERGGETPE